MPTSLTTTDLQWMLTLAGLAASIGSTLKMATTLGRVLERHETHGKMLDKHTKEIDCLRVDHAKLEGQVCGGN